MTRKTATTRICPQGHSYQKSSDCPTCPICERLRLEQNVVVPGLSAPAKRALETAGIKSIKVLAQQRQADIMRLHGMGPASLPKLNAALKAAGLKFKA